jgi:hypothetical protein
MIASTSERMVAGSCTSITASRSTPIRRATAVTQASVGFSWGSRQRRPRLLYDFTALSLYDFTRRCGCGVACGVPGRGAQRSVPLRQNRSCSSSIA